MHDRLRLLPLLMLLSSPVVATAADEGPAVVDTVSGGHWHAGNQDGSYRIVLENVGFEHVSCQVWIEWLAAAKPGQVPATIARVPLEEASDGFWSCGSGTADLGLHDTSLTLRLSHAYSFEPRTFDVQLGPPGSYQLRGTEQPSAVPEDAGR